ncbi:cell division protein SepF [Aquihabitans sp. G128]|uniref:cell division protein SepF n=1 Tax=Aquihabitans sp. G128 TaxID=2849779 RepID=UPI001C2168E8|nr:cell division protein SepF [Aquihabitans sp. G128]QXC62264.1 cell division protein SepF [Aquihabitans sp. G128]
MWRKAMVYLGLGDDAEYDDYHAGYDDEPDRSTARDRQPQQPQRQPQPQSNVSTVTPVSAYPDEPSAIGAVRPIARTNDLRESAPVTGQTVTPSSMSTRPRPQVVRPIAVTPNAKPHLVVPASFNQAQEVADKFKNTQPVVMNLQSADRELSRRLIDFASGLCYGLGGQMERLDNQVYLLTPTNVEVSQEERRRLHERGYDT